MTSLNIILYIATLLLGLISPRVVAQRAFFVFGDSLVDNGNNNYLSTSARADRPPYGIDSPNGPTGRFSNGLNIPDIICEQLGIEPLLPSLSPELQGERLLVGANFASAGIGVLNDTGVQFMNIIRIAEQFQYFEQYQQRLAELIGEEQAIKRVKGALVLITLGGNDFVNNYFLLPVTARRLQYPNLSDYVNFVIREYQKVLYRLYELGARRVLVTGTGPLGCVPGELATQGSANGECAPEPQQAGALFNPRLNRMLQNLNSKIGTNVFIASNTKGMLDNFIQNPRKFGFKTSSIACCGQGPYNGLGLCTLASNLCRDRSVYAFWDAFHPTERANRYIVQQMMVGSNELMHPMNLSTILAIDLRT
ncbi:GDSL esterase/lipase At4g28780-like [Amaranthus tricolor]|uniref:GDSL esterase/lipase At4g28780-like n=1 Tax=Amaranthus tricolor TaxID=29722 RepID=UPI00258C9515|nr:GDSL esterase/lipase At4g28780-like [Amaranthus tricolor]